MSSSITPSFRYGPSKSRAALPIGSEKAWTGMQFASVPTQPMIASNESVLYAAYFALPGVVGSSWELSTVVLLLQSSDSYANVESPLDLRITDQPSGMTGAELSRMRTHACTCPSLPLSGSMVSDCTK